MRGIMSALVALVGRLCGRLHWRTIATRSGLEAALANHSPARVAEAAQRIASTGFVGFDVHLLRALKAWSLRDGDGADLARLHLLDALAQTNAIVPAAALRSHLRGVTEVVAFVLLARAAHVNELDLMACFRAHDRDAPHDLRWVAEGNLLCTLRTPGLAAVLLRSVPWQLRVDVISPGDREPGAGACLPFPVPLRPVSWQQDFPPLPAYSLHPGSRGELLAPGELPITFVRTVAAPGAGTTYDLGRAGDEVAQRWSWLQQLAGVTLPAPQARIVVRHDAEAVMVAAIECARSQLCAARRDLLRALVTACALSPLEVQGVDKSLTVEVFDRRSTKNGPLSIAADGG